MDADKEKIYIRKILEGDTELFGYFLRAYSIPIYKLVVQIVRVEEDAQELVQDTFIKAYSSLKKFKGNSSFSTWLYRIAYNEAIAYTRKKKREYLFIDDDAINHISIEETNELFQEAEDPEDRINRIKYCIEQLQPEEKALIVLFYYEGKSLKEIVEIMGLSLSNVKVSLHRARKKLVVLYNQNKENE